MHEPYARKLELAGEHEKCGMETCMRNRMDTENYLPKHIGPACGCEWHKPPLEDVVSLLSNGQIPVLLYHPPHDRLSSDKSSGTPYVAISHVWADGLGSTTEKGLPACQIKRLTTLTCQLVTNGAFWIDALCIPETREMRKKAIGLMARTYRDATAVLVIVSGIRSIPCSAPREEKLLRIMSSGWMQRLWTLQEGILARKLIFEFSDGLLSLEDLLPVNEEHFNVLLLSLASEIFRLKKHRDSLLNVSDVARSLRWRSTSKPEDETLAISGLLNINASELIDYPPEQRIQMFLIRIQRLPRGIIFLSGLKMEVPGFRWAPRTLMRRASSSLGFGDSQALCTSTGPHFRVYGLVF
ncbi:MAG: hypothetical protein M1834_005623 [Cirrosporium novae-zelandiae]|nr:MAG: hypothetical protein M1834_005623 [Cirrosporium novae-zelandiae]